MSGEGILSIAALAHVSEFKAHNESGKEQACQHYECAFVRSSLWPNYERAFVHSSLVFFDTVEISHLLLIESSIVCTLCFHLCKLDIY